MTLVVLAVVVAVVVVEVVAVSYTHLDVYKRQTYRSRLEWLSQGKVLTRMFELKEEVLAFLTIEGHEYADFICR